jgi:anti-sigma factor RsiW
MNPNPINDRDCAGMAPLLLRLPDGDLLLAEQAALEAHLGACPSCREEAAALTGVGAQIRECAPNPGRLPSGAVMAAQIRELDRRRTVLNLSSLFPRAAWGGVAAASLAALWFAAGLHRLAGASHEDAPRPTIHARVTPAPVLFLVDDETSGRRVVVSMGRGARP